MHIRVTYTTRRNGVFKWASVPNHSHSNTFIENPKFILTALKMGTIQYPISDHWRLWRWQKYVSLKGKYKTHQSQLIYNYFMPDCTTYFGLVRPSPCTRIHKNIDEIIHNTINFSRTEISKLQTCEKFKEVFHVSVLLWFVRKAGLPCYLRNTIIQTQLKINKLQAKQMQSSG